MFTAWRDGFRRVLAAPVVLVGVFVCTLLTAIPLAVTMRDLLQTHLGRSLMANEAADAVNYDWWQEFASQTSGLGTTFTPSIIGFGSTLDNISGLLDARSRIAPVVTAIAIYLLVWTFLSGGVIDRYARQRSIRTYGFFAVCGVFFFRFLKLAVVAGLLYWFLFTYVHGWLFTDWYTRMTRDLASERTAFVWRFAMYAMFGALLAAVNVLFDYAKIRAVIEDRRSALGAVRAAFGFIRRNPGKVATLYALNVATFCVLVGVWALTAPDAGGAGASLWIGFALAQLYLLARLVLKLQFIASETALFQSLLAHARYTAVPEPAWPQSAAAEAIP